MSGTRAGIPVSVAEARAAITGHPDPAYWKFLVEQLCERLEAAEAPRRPAKAPTARDALLADLESGPTLTLSALADLAEERGDPAAPGWRWLAMLGKFPASDRGLWWWMGPRDGDRPGTTPPELPGSAAARLPAAVVGRIAEGCREVVGRRRGEFDTKREAFEAAAVAVAEWLEGRA